jgi:hypothetical protein
MRTPRVPVRLVPLITTLVPPCADPEDLEIELTVGIEGQSEMFETIVGAAGKFMALNREGNAKSPEAGGFWSQAKFLTIELLDGLTTQTNLGVSRKASESIDKIVLGKVTVLRTRFVAPLSAPIVFIPSGITREVNFRFVRIVLGPIEVKLVGVSNVSETISDSQNAPSILVTLFGISTLISPVP